MRKGLRGLRPLFGWQGLLTLSQEWRSLRSLGSLVRSGFEYVPLVLLHP